LFLRLMADVRAAIAAGTFATFRREFIANYTPSRRVLSQRGD
jgi:queuine/archaeosine tRNA-ribosyltransferase